MVTQAKRECNARYDAKNTIVKSLKFNKNTDAVILERIEQVSFQTYVKELIRKDIRENP